MLAQKIPVAPIDSLITVGYATGSLKTPVRLRRENHGDTDEQRPDNEPFEAIRGRVPV